MWVGHPPSLHATLWDHRRIVALPANPGLVCTDRSLKKYRPNSQSAASCQQNWTFPVQRSQSPPFWRACCAMGCSWVQSSSSSASWLSSSPHPKDMNKYVDTKGKRGAGFVSKPIPPSNNVSLAVALSSWVKAESRFYISLRLMALLYSSKFPTQISKSYSDSLWGADWCSCFLNMKTW